MSARRGWDAALDEANALFASFQSNDMQEYLATFADSMTQRGKMFDPVTMQASDKDGTEDDRQMTLQSIGAAMQSVAGVPIWVGEEVVELIEHAQETFKPEAIYPDDPFVDCGFALLERPLIILDRHGKRCANRAISWIRWQDEDNPGRQGLIIATWGHRDDKDDYWGEGAKNHERLTDAGYDKLPLMGGTPLTLSHVSSPLRFGDDRMLAEPTHHALYRQVQVMWRLAKQEVIVSGNQRVSRPAWRRKSNWRQIKEVVVLTLRRARPRKYEGEERDVEWSHRWWVSGHWRAQWYPSLQRHMQIWIDPFTKGPEDKPLIYKDRAIEFIR